MQVATTSFSKVNIQVDPKFNIPITRYIESMLPHWQQSLVHTHITLNFINTWSTIGDGSKLKHNVIAIEGNMG